MTTQFVTDLQDIIGAIQLIARAQALMRAAPDMITDSANIFPFAVTICRNVAWGIAVADCMQADAATFATQIHVARKDAARDLTSVQGYGLTFPKAIWQGSPLAPNYGTVPVNGVRARFAVMEYAGVQTIGWDIEIDIKLIVNLS